MVELPWGEPVTPVNKEEQVLLGPLIDFLNKTNRINEYTIVKLELPWNGRRIDLATLSRSLTTTAYELKLSSIQRAVEQASYSRLSFDRSWVVTSGRVKSSAIGEAQGLGIGIMSLVNDRIQILATAQRQQRTSPVIRSRLIQKLRTKGGYRV